MITSDRFYVLEITDKNGDKTYRFNFKLIKFTDNIFEAKRFKTKKQARAAASQLRSHRNLEDVYGKATVKVLCVELEAKILTDEQENNCTILV